MYRFVYEPTLCELTYMFVPLRVLTSIDIFQLLLYMQAEPTEIVITYIYTSIHISRIISRMLVINHVVRDSHYVCTPASALH